MSAPLDTQSLSSALRRIADELDTEGRAMEIAEEQRAIDAHIKEVTAPGSFLKRLDARRGRDEGGASSGAQSGSAQVLTMNSKGRNP